MSHNTLAGMRLLRSGGWLTGCLGLAFLAAPLGAEGQIFFAPGSAAPPPSIIKPAVTQIRPAVGPIQPVVPTTPCPPKGSTTCPPVCRPTYPGYWVGGYGIGYSAPQPEAVPVPVPYPVPVPDPIAGYIDVKPNVYTTLTVPSASGDGRQLMVDVIRGARDSAPAQRISDSQLASTRAEQAVEALNLLKPDLPSDKLIDFLSEPVPQVRLQALDLLLARGNAGLAALQQATTSPEANTRMAAMAALTHAAANPERLALAGEVLPILYEALDDPAVQVRRVAAAGIGMLAPAANADVTIERLMASLRDPDDAVRSQAAQSLAWLKEPAVAPLVKALESRFDQFRNAASEALGQIGAPALPALVAALESPLPEVRYSAASALGDMGNVAQSALPTLRRLATHDADANVRWYAQAAVRRIDR